MTSDGVRLFLHTLAAAVWVGGQIGLAGLVPVVRRAGQEAVTAAARRFQLLAWPAWATLLVTGLWNLDAADFSRQSHPWQATVMAKIGAFVAAGALTAGHSLAGARVRRSDTRAPRWRAVAGATAGLPLLTWLLSSGASSCGPEDAMGPSAAAR